jgi:hypothetical protein
MRPKTSTVAAYLASLDPGRRREIEAVRGVILENIGVGFEEGMQYGMIGYFVPHRVYPAGYHCDPSQPLPFAGLASRKRGMSIYLMSVYGDPDEERLVREGFAKAGKKLDMGKSCIRFKTLGDLPLRVIGEAIRRVTCRAYLERYEAALAGRPGTRAEPASMKPGDTAKGGKARALTRPAKKGATKTPEKAADSKKTARGASAARSHGGG